MNDMLGIVLKLFYRLSFREQSEEEYLPLDVYADIVYENFLFDMPKLYDIVAIYGQSNPVTVKTLVSNVCSNDKRFINDFGESIATIITLLKKSFTTSLKVSDMIRGDGVVSYNRNEQDEIIKSLMLDLIEIMSNVENMTMYFPDNMLEAVRNTSLTMFMANVYSLMIGPVKQ